MRRSHLYSDVAENGAGILRLKTKSGALALFNGRGGLIPDKNVIIDDGAEVVWTLGGYLRARHISPEQARLGVGIIDKHQASEATQSSDSDGTSAADVQVVVRNQCVMHYMLKMFHKHMIEINCMIFLLPRVWNQPARKQQPLTQGKVL